MSDHLRSYIGIRFVINPNGAQLDQQAAQPVFVLRDPAVEPSIKVALRQHVANFFGGAVAVPAMDIGLFGFLVEKKSALQGLRNMMLFLARHDDTRC